MNDRQTSSADLHCHSTASAVSRLGVQRSVGLPECATPPEEVYELAKRRGMDYVTITDHDTIDGALEIADRPDTFVSVELTARFRGEPLAAVHILCWGIDPDDHEWLQGNAANVERCAAYLVENDIACALAHPFYAVEQPLSSRHRKRLTELFPIWETRNGSRARELNMPAAVYIETHGGTGVGGSDDHAGVDIGRTFTSTAAVSTPDQFLAEIRSGRAKALGDQGSAAKWAHSAIALALRTHGYTDADPPDPRAVLTILERVMREGDARSGGAEADLGPDDARRLLAAWLAPLELEGGPERLIELMQADGFSHADLARRVRRVHERRMAEAVDFIGGTAAPAGAWQLAAGALFHAITPAIPYVPATAFLELEKRKLSRRDSEPRRVALVADGIGATHGVARTIEELRERGVPGYEVEVIGTDPHVDHRLAAVAELELPFYREVSLAVPAITALTEALAERAYDLIHLVSPGPLGIGGALVARVIGTPTIGSYHTELAAYAGLRTGEATIEDSARAALALFYRSFERVLSPSVAADGSLGALGVRQEVIGRWDRGVDAARFAAGARPPGPSCEQVTVLYAGRLTVEKGTELLAEAFLTAARLDPRLHLVVAGDGPEEVILREQLGDRATFLGWLAHDRLPDVYAASDMFLFPSRTDTFGQVVLEAQASGLAVVAVAEGGPLDLISDGIDGLLREPTADALADALVLLAREPGLRARLGRAAAGAVSERTWAASIDQLAEGYRSVLTRSPEVLGRAAA